MAESLSEVPGVVPDKVKVFLGLMTEEGYLRCYQNPEIKCFGLLGGEVENDPSYYLNPGVLLREASQEAKRAGIAITDFPVSYVYHAVSEDAGNKIWNFIIPVCYGYWKEQEDLGRQVLDIGPDDFDICRILGLFDKIQRVAGLVCFFCVYGEGKWGVQAAGLLDAINPDWKTGLFADPYHDLAGMRDKYI